MDGFGGYESEEAMVKRLHERFGWSSWEEVKKAKEERAKAEAEAKAKAEAEAAAEAEAEAEAESAE